MNGIKINNLKLYTLRYQVIGIETNAHISIPIHDLFTITIMNNNSVIISDDHNNIPKASSKFPILTPLI